jgi:hypothetical protein
MLVSANKLDRRDGFGCENAGRTCRSQYMRERGGPNLNFGGSGYYHGLAKFSLGVGLCVL